MTYDVLQSYITLNNLTAGRPSYAGLKAFEHARRRGWVIGPAGEIVEADVVKPRDGEDHIERRDPDLLLIAAVDLPLHREGLSDKLLGEAVFGAKVTETLIEGFHETTSF